MLSCDENGTISLEEVINDVNKKNVIAVDTIEDMLNIDNETYKAVIVRDDARGGVFVYDSSMATENDSGIIFNGWVRQYNGQVNVKWFGNTSNEATFKTASDVSQPVYVEPGTYTLDGNTINFSGIIFYSFGDVTINTNTTLIVKNLIA